NIEELLNGIKDFIDNDISEEKTVSSFLQSVALITDQDNEEQDLNKVQLMTVHLAKGLEFPYVYIVGLEENLFPSAMNLNSRNELEEERRLFYVALTRAEKAAFLSYAQTRFKFGNITYAEPSRFISEIPLDFIEMPEVRPPRNYAGTQLNEINHFARRSPIPPGKKLVSLERAAKFEKPNAKSEAERLNSSVKEGQTVEHLRFGRGKVIKVEGIGPNKKAVISFGKHGQKQILLKFAKLKIVG
ncbi:MAG: ATP-dependent DNA helicase, partial [Flavobacteriales bacterium]|nr:ATP-dependent DNA helicase [Flavobacteriales bacterium]